MTIYVKNHKATCLICGNLFVSRIGTKYCSAKCRQKNWNDAHRNERRAYSKKYNIENREKCRTKLERWREKNREHCNKLATKHSRKSREKLNDSYIKKLFQHLCKAAIVPEHVILQKRESIKLKRLIHEKSRQVNAY